MNELKIGDIVRLKSGGPKMTVEGFKWNHFENKHDTNQVQCTWFVDQVRHTEYFTKDALTKDE
jgi:uncharacterized protein YodC (DUF2158 family)